MIGNDLYNIFVGPFVMGFSFAFFIFFVLWGLKKILQVFKTVSKI